MCKPTGCDVTEPQDAMPPVSEASAQRQILSYATMSAGRRARIEAMRAASADTRKQISRLAVDEAYLLRLNKYLDGTTDMNKGNVKRPKEPHAAFFAACRKTTPDLEARLLKDRAPPGQSSVELALAEIQRIGKAAYIKMLRDDQLDD